LVTCKDFLRELNEYLDEDARPEARRELQAHLDECPNCWVICDTTRKTIAVYRGMEPQAIPPTVHERLISALHKKTTDPHS
jgi:anti-sigma factor RsiW